MYGYNLVAIYNSLEDARHVSDRLLAEGIQPADLRLTRAPLTRDTAAEQPAPDRDRGFFDWLFASDVPADDRDRYASHLDADRAAVSVRAADEGWRTRIVAIMEEFNPIDIEGDAHPHEASQLGKTSVPTAGTAARTEAAGEHEQVIPVVKEELDIGKRATEQRHRIRSYVIERPIEEQVMLRDERVEIEHRPVSRTGAQARMPEEREVEIVERHEEPVVEKRTTADEEIVIRKEVTERPEIVRGTVRETKVEVDKEPAGTTEHGLGKSGSTPGRERP